MVGVGGYGVCVCVIVREKGTEGSAKGLSILLNYLDVDIFVAIGDNFEGKSLEDCEFVLRAF